jgi:transcriptional regulator with XRE-family HTH domain
MAQRTIGENVRRYREKAGLAQEALARAADMSVGNLSQIERGKVENPRIGTLVALARALGVGPGALIAGTQWDVK